MIKKKHLSIVFFTLSITLSLMIDVSAHAQAPQNFINTLAEPAQVDLVKKQPYAYPFSDYEAFITFMKSSPSWQESVLRKSFPESLYQACVDPQKMEFLEIIYQTPNGHTRGWIIRPLNTQRQLPVVVFNRGGFAKWGRVFPYELLSLCQVASHGYMVVASDFRGPKNADVVGKHDVTDLGYGDVNDSFYLLQAIKGAYPKLVDTTNVAVWGFSRGTSITALMTKRSENIKLVIMQGMVADLVDNDRRDEFDTHVYPLLIEDYMQLSKAEQDELLSGISPKYLIDEIHGTPSFLIFHGAKDKRTSPHDAMQYASDLLKRNYDVEFHLYPDSGHVLSDKFDTYINEVISALDQHLTKIQ